MYMHIMILLQIFIQLFILNNYHVCYAAQYNKIQKYNHDVINQSNLIYSKENNNIHVYYTGLYQNNANKVDGNYYKKHIKNINTNKNIYKHSQYHDKSYVCLYHKKNRPNQYTIQIQNDSINLLQIFYNKFPENYLYNRVLYFSQFGIQHVLSENIMSMGLGKRYLCNNQYVIGYNTLLHIPILSKILQSAAMNVGGEYWYKNLMFSLNGYYNLDKILHFNKLLYTKLITCPKIGYQIQCQVKFPYIVGCQGKIKWEQFYGNKKNNSVLFNQFNKNQHTLSIGMKYQPIPILEFNIDHVFMKKQSIHTILKVALNYQFNVPITQQIYQKYYCKKQQCLSPNDLNVIIEPFIPKFSCVIIDDPFKNSEIIGFPGEIKYIKINDNNTELTWDIQLLNQYGGRISYIKNNIYALYLPKSSELVNDPLSISYEIQDELGIQNRKKNISIILKNNPISNIKNQIHDNIYLIKDNEDPCIFPKEQNTSIQQNQNNQYVMINNDNSNSNSNSSDTNSDVLSSLNNTVIHTNNITNTNNDNTLLFNSPPPPPKLPIFLEDTTLPSCSNQVSCSIKELSIDQSSNNDMIPDCANINNHFMTKKREHVNKTINEDKNLFCQLSIQKNTKFSSIGTQEYIEKLENSILERRKDKKVTDIEKMFHKLHITLSQSSIEESVETTDSIDSFSESSNF